jgi:hypothetical protein
MEQSRADLIIAASRGNIRLRHDACPASDPACYVAATGKQIYKERLGGKGGYTASPVAADGKIYFISEESGVRVVRAGPQFELLAINPLGEPCMATPAISDGMIFIRTQHHLFGIGRKE